MAQRVIVVGAGFGGIATAIELRAHGITDVTILDSAPEIGGTWHHNSYPGAACDVPSHLYSFSFAQRRDWSRLCSPQPEILEYLQNVAREYGVDELVVPNAAVSSCRLDEATMTWTVSTSDGREFTGDTLVLATGQLNTPAIPDIPGADSFAGPTMHSARWDHDVDLRGKKVAVIGTGASAIQFVPQIAGVAAEVQLYQRTPAWVLPKGDRPLSSRRRAFLARHPRAHRAYRAAVYAALESRAVGFTTNPALLRPVEWLATQHIKASIDDPDLVATLTPDYSIGCKRILVSNDYYRPWRAPTSR